MDTSNMAREDGGDLMTSKLSSSFEDSDNLIPLSHGVFRELHPFYNMNT